MILKMKKLANNNSGFTLAELLIATVLMAVIFTGVLMTILKCMELTDIARNSSAAVVAAKNKMMEIENTSYASIVGTYHNVPFTVDGFNAKGVSYATSASQLITITAAVCWKQPNGRVFGEDSDLDGVLDAGEDRNGNGRIDSVVQVTTTKNALP